MTVNMASIIIFCILGAIGLVALFAIGSLVGRILKRVAENYPEVE